MKVCHMTSVHKSQDVRILKKQCTSLARAGYEVYLVAPGESYEENGVQVVGVGEHVGGRLKRMTQMTKRVYNKALALDCDIYELHDPELLPFALKLKRKGKKVIFDSHEDVVNHIREKTYLNSFMRKHLAFHLGAYIRYVVRRLDAVIYVTPHMQKFAQDWNFRNIMITNYPILKIQEECTTVEDDKKHLMFAGGIRPLWCHDLIIEAIQPLDVCYTICGPVTNDYMESLKQIDRNHRMNYLGIIKHEEVAQLFQKAFVGMSVLEYHQNVGGNIGTLGNTKIFEYMMAGIPIICTDFILWKEIVDKYDCGICIMPKDIHQIQSAIQYLTENPEHAKQMGENGRRAIEEEFNWEREERKLLQLYKELADRRHTDI